MKLSIPYYLHKAGAGFPSPATDYIEEDIDLNMHLIRNVPATFIIRVQGKSMVDVGINDGDLLVVDKSLKPKNFSTVIANVHDELVVKTLVQEKDKKFKWKWIVFFPLTRAPKGMKLLLWDIWAVPVIYIFTM